MSMRELLRMEVEAQSRTLVDNLLELEQGALSDSHLEAMMRAAHSMKGGARIADLPPAVELAHVMEDLFVAARAGQAALLSHRVDVLLRAVDLARCPDGDRAGTQRDRRHSGSVAGKGEGPGQPGRPGCRAARLRTEPGTRSDR